METIIVIAMIAILGAIAIPSITSQRTRANFRNAVSMIQGDLEIARSRAIRENAFVVVQINDAGDGFTVFIDNGSGTGGVSGNWVRDGNEIQIASGQLPPDLKFDLTQTTFIDATHPTATRYDGRGYNTNYGTIAIGNSGGKTATIDMNNRFGHITATY